MKATEDPCLDQEEVGITARQMHLFIRDQVRKALMEVVQQEVSSLCGPRHHPGEDARAYRSGTVRSPVYVEDRREMLRRPRVRCEDDSGNREVRLRSWQLAQDPKQWEEASMRALLNGVSTRKVGKLRGQSQRGESSSNLSRLWQKKAQQFVDEFRLRDLSGQDIAVLMLDAVVLSREVVVTVGLGIDSCGIKHILGYRVGSSENEEVCHDLLSDLVGRGLQVASGRRLLAVLDGSKALKKALLRVFPDALIQRCLVHKERNLKGYLSKRHWRGVSDCFNSLRKAQGSEEAKAAMERLIRFLSDKNAQARDSLQEAGAELLSFFELDVPNTLNIPLLSTNAIENVFRNLRRHLGRVSRWRSSTHQADLWVASGLAMAEEGFRKIRGYREMPELIKSLEKSAARKQCV